MKHKQNKTYYEIADDLKAFPKAWVYAVVGGRNTGKTYGSLKHYSITEKKPFTYAKRTNDDVDMICAGHSIGQKNLSVEVDLSPYKSINRDFNTNIHAYKIRNGIGGFYNTVEGEAVGAPISYLVSLNAVHKIKGFDLSDSEALEVDEFAPQPWERVSRSEGEQTLELYKTISRDRVLRGRGELKLILFSNAVNVWTPITDTLGIADMIAEMYVHGKELYYDSFRGILIRILDTPEEMIGAEANTGLYKTMRNKPWGRMAFGNEFAYNDFSKIRKVALKGYRGVCSVDKNGEKWYIYVNDSGTYYVTLSRFESSVHYDLSIEFDQKAFYLDQVLNILDAAIIGKAWFEKYGMYDLITNYKRRYTVS